MAFLAGRVHRKRFFRFQMILISAPLLLAGILLSPLMAEKPLRYHPLAKGLLNPDGSLRVLSLAETIQLVLENNDDVALQQLDILTADTELMKDESQYSPVIEAGAQKLYTEDKKYPNYAKNGNIKETRRYYAKLKQLFKSGTYFELEGSDTRVDTNAGEVTIFDQWKGSGGDIYRPARPLHEGALKIVLRQELLKNAFGYNQRRLNEINRNLAKIQRENMTFRLMSIVVDAMINYWNLSIAEEELKTNELLLRNTRNIRTITLRKRRIGLAESFEVNQWNALLARAETSVKLAKLDRDTKKRDLLRIMNLDPTLRLTGQTKLITELPKDINPKEDLDYAYKTRPDFLALTLQMKNAERALEIAQNQLLPSMSVGGNYKSRSYGLHARSAYNEVPNNRYPDYALEFKVEYPLWDEGARVEARNALINLRKLRIEERKLKRQIQDDIELGYEQIRVTYVAMRNAQKAFRETQAYYKGLVYRYRQGRFTATAVKEALDQLVQASQALTEAAINYNISLIRYDFVRNKIFVKYQIDINKVIDRLLTKRHPEELLYEKKARQEVKKDN